MIEEDAFHLYDFIQQRVFGWTVVLGSNNPHQRIDSRTNQGKLSDRLLREFFVLAPPADECLDRLASGETPENLWPESHREFIRFCLWHRVPRDINEPLIETTPEGCGPARLWPDFLRQYDKVATLSDMPEPPPPSEEYKAFKNRRTNQ